MGKSKNIIKNFIPLIIVVLITLFSLAGCIEFVNITSCPNSDPSPLECAKIELNFLNESYPYMGLLGEVINECSQDISCIHIQGVCYDHQDNELGRAEMYLGEILAGKTMNFVLDVKTSSINNDWCSIEILEGAYK